MNENWLKKNKKKTESFKEVSENNIIILLLVLWAC